MRCGQISYSHVARPCVRCARVCTLYAVLSIWMRIYCVKFHEDGFSLFPSTVCECVCSLFWEHSFLWSMDGIFFLSFSTSSHYSQFVCMLMFSMHFACNICIVQYEKLPVIQHVNGSKHRTIAITPARCYNVCWLRERVASMSLYLYIRPLPPPVPHLRTFLFYSMLFSRLSHF